MKFKKMISFVVLGVSVAMISTAVHAESSTCDLSGPWYIYYDQTDITSDAMGFVENITSPESDDYVFKITNYGYVESTDEHPVVNATPSKSSEGTSLGGSTTYTNLAFEAEVDGGWGLSSTRGAAQIQATKQEYLCGTSSTTNPTGLTARIQPPCTYLPMTTGGNEYRSHWTRKPVKCW